MSCAYGVPALLYAMARSVSDDLLRSSIFQLVFKHSSQSIETRLLLCINQVDNKIKSIYYLSFDINKTMLTMLCIPSYAVLYFVHTMLIILLVQPNNSM